MSTSAVKLIPNTSWPLVVFQKIEDVEPWYFCAACGWRDLRENWTPIDWECPECGVRDGTYPMECNFGIRHEDGNIDNLSDCMKSFMEYGHIVRHGDCGCRNEYKHVVVEAKDEAVWLNH